MKKKIQNNQMLTLYHIVWQKKNVIIIIIIIKKIENKIKQETNATVKVKMVKKLCA